MRDSMAVTKALSDGNRVRVLATLRRGELCVCQIIELLHLAPYLAETQPTMYSSPTARRYDGGVSAITDAKVGNGRAHHGSGSGEPPNE